jgi:hypothetical protein
LKVDNCNHVLSSADDSPLNILGKTDVVIESHSKSVKADVYVLVGARCDILGLNELQNLNLLASSNLGYCKALSGVLAPQDKAAIVFVVDSCRKFNNDDYEVA